jgi:ubiquitin C-terminal hydrolase
MACFKDAHEFLQLLASVWSNETAPNAWRHFEQIRKQTGHFDNRNELACLVVPKHHLDHMSFRKDPMTGLLAYKMTCHTCGYSVSDLLRFL